MAHVVIIGASTGGLSAAYDLRTTLGKQHQITVISNSDTFHLVPSNPWVAVGWRSRQDTTFELAPYLSKKNIVFIPMAAQEIKRTTIRSFWWTVEWRTTIIWSSPPAPNWR